MTNPETIDTPVPLYPTCLDACGNMVALGTREGPVLLFDTTSSGGGGGGVSSGRCRDGGPPAIETNAAAERSAITPRAAAAARVPGKAATPTTASDGSSSSRSESTASVTRVYGSLADGTGPTTAVLLDRAKVIAAGRGSRRSGGGFVIRYDLFFCVLFRGASRAAAVGAERDNDDDNDVREWYHYFAASSTIGASLGMLRTGAVVRCGAFSTRASSVGRSSCCLRCFERECFPHPSDLPACVKCRVWTTVRLGCNYNCDK